MAKKARRTAARVTTPVRTGRADIRRLVLRVAVSASALALVPLLVRIVPLAFQHALREITASAAARLVGIAGIGCTLVDGTALRLQHHILRIDFACTAIDLTAMFVILVLAMPIATKRKVQGLVVGVPTVLTANLGRLVMVAGVSQWAPEQFGWVHGLLFVALMAVFVAGAWGVWLRISRNDWDEGWDS